MHMLRCSAWKGWEHHGGRAGMHDAGSGEKDTGRTQAGGGIPSGKSACPVITAAWACHRHACMRHSQQLWSWLPPRQEELVRVGTSPPPWKDKGTHGASDAGRQVGRRKQALLMPVMGQAAKRTNQGRRGGRKGRDRPRQQR